MSTISTTSATSFVTDKVTNLFFDSVVRNQLTKLFLKKCKEKELAGLILILKVLPRSQHQLEG
ncbi:hypothetical protein RirG_203260 [Rhizophagus irregularis DAOM 197198w]|uniref:Uncharacterized protein n=1 Tax=Rhizophagus irregularis (strain DAOM 197198w) TaxID=1432141 RepID=A0A015JS38_RHIIW|nr:hypothetical protein RirG_203260 [Rhizophagus irregularis DAOM 197198w]